MQPDSKRYWLDDAANVRKVYIGVWVICIFVGLLDVAHVYHKHVHFRWEQLWNYYGFYGFVSCISLVLAAKVLRRIVMRKEDFYD